jgi:hypothetical protein
MDHATVGPAKPITYLPIDTIEKVLGLTIAKYAELVKRRGGECAVFSTSETCIKSGAVYCYDPATLAALLDGHARQFEQLGWRQSRRHLSRRSLKNGSMNNTL